MSLSGVSLLLFDARAALMPPFLLDCHGQSIKGWGSCEYTQIQTPIPAPEIMDMETCDVK